MKKIERTPVSNNFVAVRISDLNELESALEKSEEENKKADEYESCLSEIHDLLFYYNGYGGYEGLFNAIKRIADESLPTPPQEKENEG